MPNHDESYHFDKHGRPFRRENLRNGADLVLLSVGVSAEHPYDDTNKIRVAEIDHGTNYYAITGKNVRTSVAEFTYHFRDKSGMHRAFCQAAAIFEARLEENHTALGD